MVTTYSSFPELDVFKELCSKAASNIANSDYDKDIFMNYITYKMFKKYYGDVEFSKLEELVEKYNLKIGEHSCNLKAMVANTKSRAFDYVWYPNNEDFSLPSRATSKSAGYDFFLPREVTVSADAPIFIGLGVKAYMQDNEYLALTIRSSLSKKMYILNGVGIIDSDYADNIDNGGEIGCMLQCYPGIPDVTLKKGERVLQGIFMDYKTTVLDVPRSNDRSGGFGSTGK